MELSCCLGEREEEEDRLTTTFFVRNYSVEQRLAGSRHCEDVK